MSSWGNYDNAANTPLWAVNASIVKNNPTKSAPTRANVTLLYANTTPNVYVQNETIGVFGISHNEAQVAELTAHVPHTGWVYRTVGQGGRAGRVQHEVLVAMGMGRRDDGDGQTYPNVAITLVGPSSVTVKTNATFSNVATLSVTPTLTGNTGARLTYTWQYNNAAGSLGWVAVANNDISNTHIAGMTTNTLTVAPKTYITANNALVYRLVIDANDQGVTKTSANATITIPS